MSWRRVGSVALAALVAGVCVASVATGSTGRATTANVKKTIFVFAYFPHSAVSGTWAWYNGWMEAAAQLKLNYNVVVKEEASVDTDPANFLNFIKTGLVQQPDGVVVVPNNSVALAPGLRQLAAQYPKIKFLAMDQPVPDWSDVSFVGTSNVKAGAQAGQWLLRQYRQHKLPSNQVAIFRAPPGTASQDQRVAGFLAALKGSPLKVVDAVQTADPSTSTALTNMADVLTGHPNLGTVFSTANYYGSGVAEELVKAHKLGIVNVSVGPDTLSLQQIVAHAGFTAEVAQHYKDTGYLAVLTLARAMAGQSVPKTIDVGTTFVTASNARAYLKQVEAEAKPPS
jgi:ABC-type sugar transport system substrate-binding protein